MTPCRGPRPIPIPPRPTPIQLIEGGLCPPETLCADQDPPPALVAFRGEPARGAKPLSRSGGRSPKRDREAAPPGESRGRRPPQHDRGTTLVSRGPRRVCEPGGHHLFKGRPRLSGARVSPPG